MEKECKKVGIVTLTGDNNYGQSLQNYALIQTLNGLGISSKTVKQNLFYNCYKGMKENKIRFAFAKSVYSSLLRLKANKKNKRIKSFDIFNKSIDFISYNESKVFKKKIDNFDYIICGSDQIWNMEFVKAQVDFYFAKFVPQQKRIAYSASIGTDDISQDMVSYFNEAVLEFKDISVRENRGAQIIKKYTNREVLTTVDPTLLLSAEKWRDVEKSVDINGKYILTYFLGNKSDEIERYINKIAKENDCKIVNLYGEKYCYLNDSAYNYGPSEFLWLVDNCELMLTDSFHGCCFSVIFNKPFRWFSRCEEHISSMNSRMETLFEKLQLDDKFIGNTEEYDGLFDVDYSKTEELILKEQEFAYKYLKGALNLNEN